MWIGMFGYHQQDVHMTVGKEDHCSLLRCHIANAMHPQVTRWRYHCAPTVTGLVALDQDFGADGYDVSGEPHHHLDPWCIIVKESAKGSDYVNRIISDDKGTVSAGVIRCTKGP